MSLALEATPSAGVAALPPDRAKAVEALYATGHWLLTQARFADAASVFRAMAVFAPEDERAWLGLGSCHEGIDQLDLAAEMYGTGRLLAGPSFRCEIARARVLRRLEREDEADKAIAEAERLAHELDDDEARALVRAERGR